MINDFEKRWMIFMEINEERNRQESKWGMQTHPVRSATRSIDDDIQKSLVAKHECDKNTKNGTLSWYDVLLEEFREVFAETNPTRQRGELIQVAAVAVSIIQDIDNQLSANDDCAGQNCAACANPCEKYIESLR